MCVLCFDNIVFHKQTIHIDEIRCLDPLVEVDMLADMKVGNELRVGVTQTKLTIA